VLVSWLLRLVRAVGPRVRLWLVRFVGWLAWALGIRRTVTLENLKHAFPEKTEAERRRLARGAYRTMALAAMEAVTSDLVSSEELLQDPAAVDWKGLDRLIEARAPVLVVSGHLGSWELFVEVMARRGMAISAVARPLSGAFNEWVVRSRQAAGLELIMPRGAMVEMARALNRGRAVVQLIDQALPSPSALWVPFFGRLASTTPAVSLIALRTRVPVYVAVAVREPAGLRMFVEGPFPVSTEMPRAQAVVAHTAQLTAVLESYIRRYPEQWLWLHRRWKGTPPVGSTPA
jgi:KDO2-lipid IV(A) lauroyltransferase